MSKFEISDLMQIFKILTMNLLFLGLNIQLESTIIPFKTQHPTSNLHLS